MHPMRQVSNKGYGGYDVANISLRVRKCNTEEQIDVGAMNSDSRYVNEKVSHRLSVRLK